LRWTRAEEGYDAHRLNAKGISATGPAAPRLPALTGIRILAAVAVYASHVGPPAGAPDFVANFFVSGYCGVTLFFVLSGFVLALNYFDMRRPSSGRIYNYFVARFARVYPLYLLLLLYYVVRQNAFGEGIDGWWRNAIAIQPWDPDLADAYSFDPPSWSIGVEFFLYACFPLLIPLLARLRRPRTVLIAAAATVAGMAALAGWFVLTGADDLSRWNPSSAHRWLYRMPLTRLGDFTLGILAALLYLQTRDRPSVSRIGLPLVLGSALATIGLMCWQGLLFTPWSWDLAYAVPAVVFIFGLAIAPLSWAARALSLPFVVLLGEASYAFYLVHFPAAGLFEARQWAAVTSLSTVAYEALVFGAILALAIGLHVGFERPARTYIRRLLRRRKEQTAPVAARPASEPVGS
jgi:peptidoglycan/LPS O-acetylase OafA/YrhL